MSGAESLATAWPACSWPSPFRGSARGTAPKGVPPKASTTIAELRLVRRSSLTRFVLKGDHVDVYVYTGRRPDARKAS